MSSPSSRKRAPAAWRGPRWLRTVQVLSGEAAVQQPHPHRNWARAAEAAILAWVGNGAHDLALHRRNWVASQKYFVEWCVRSCRTPALTWHAAV